MKTAAVLGDLHSPYHDRKAVALVLKFCKIIEPDIVVIDGDLTDFYLLSHFDKDPRDAYTLNSELRFAYDILKEFRKVCKQLDYIEGNHENRFNRYLISKAEELVGLTTANGKADILSLQYLLELEDLGVNFIPMIGKEAYKRYNDLYIGHYNRVAKHSAYTAKALVDDKGVSILQNHVHRMGYYTKTLLNGKNLVGVENGCLCDLKPKYVQNPNWQQGFTILHLDDNGHDFSVEPIHIMNHEFYYGGSKFSL